jgi:hypothetical protein
MHVVTHAAVALALSILVAGPARADVIPTRRAAPSDAPERVRTRLVQMGLSAEQARAQALDLTSGEAEYFARSPERLQWVGQEMWAGQSDNMWWEWLFGLAALAGVGVGFYIFAVVND